MSTGGRWRTIVAAGLLVLALFGSQALADVTAPQGTTATGEIISRSGFAYLTGIRTFVAAVLYARLDPINDGYYPGTTLPQKRFLIPSLYAIITLDPHFEQPYYVTPWILVDSGRMPDALRLARQAVADNPRSGLLHASLAQIALQSGHPAEAVREGDAARRPDTYWTTPEDRHNSLVGIEAIYQHVGDHARADAVMRQRLRLEGQPLPPPAPGR